MHFNFKKTQPDSKQTTSYFKAIAAIGIGLSLCTQSIFAKEKDMLSTQQQNIIPVAAFTANGDITALKQAIGKGLDAGLSINQIREVLIQMYAYVGFPRSLNGINAMVEVLDERKAQGIKDTVGQDATPLPKDTDINAKGNQTRNDIFKTDLTHNQAAYAQFAPMIDVYLKEHLFGDIFARDVLDYQQRELATVAALAAISGTDAQLKGHLNASMNVGLTPEQLDAFAQIMRQAVSPESGQRIETLLAEIEASR
ncbi:Carboxymuconolactone decarboxylase family protein [Acinetobacter marinus]|uniref:Carboxymuconolactone decarboxylase family protein n=1 Tax=Acinetobacter marinus TaxID=281375 RepID=A0A1G6ILI4_9GAMM|nr:carboxymuconolactone decarboxylase family protein [Acinetobacter marinus]SDC06626.1 Carboxymuconolactone decarboxylase family protein [Acinetobacter marinus]